MNRIPCFLCEKLDDCKPYAFYHEGKLQDIGWVCHDHDMSIGMSIPIPMAIDNETLMHTYNCYIHATRQLAKK